MTNEFLEYYNSNIGDNNRSVDELLKKLFSTKVDPLFSYLRVITNSCKLLPDTTVKYMDKPKVYFSFRNESKETNQQNDDYYFRCKKAK